jgi:hypothetical protein
MSGEKLEQAQEALGNVKNMVPEDKMAQVTDAFANIKEVSEEKLEQAKEALNRGKDEA